MESLQRNCSKLGRILVCVAACVSIVAVSTGCGRAKDTPHPASASAEVTKAIKYKLDDFAKIVEVLAVHTKQTLTEDDCDADHPFCVSTNDGQSSDSQFDPTSEALKIPHTDSDMKLAKEYADYIGDDLTAARVSIDVHYAVPMPLQNNPVTRYMVNADVTAEFSSSKYQFDASSSGASMSNMTDPVSFIVDVPNGNEMSPLEPSVQAYSIFDVAELESQASAEAARRAQLPWWQQWWEEFTNPIYKES